MSDWMVTTNVGAGFGGAVRSEGMLRWARKAVDRNPRWVFAQEVPVTEWLDVWRAANYQMVLGPDKGWKVRSALLLRRDVLVLRDLAWHNSNYHGSYLAGAVVETEVGPTALLSVHASPQEAEPEKYGWVGPRPEPRGGGGDSRYVGRRLWDSDLVLHSLIEVAADLPLIAAGDLNEAVGHDLDPRTGHVGSWGREYFERLRAAGLHEVLSSHWGGERPTREALQLDRVVASPVALRLVGDGEPETDAAWDDANQVSGLSDHRAVWVPLY